MRFAPRNCLILVLHLAVQLLAAALDAGPGESIDEFLHASLTSYELLPPIRLISKRGATDGGAEGLEHLHFQAFHQQFHVTLRPDSRVALMEAVRVVVMENDTAQSAGIVSEDLFSGFYTGYIDDDPNSHASGYVSGARVHLTIERGDQQVLNIEPLSLLTGNLSEKRLLAYYDSGINGSQFRCGLSDTPADAGDWTAPPRDLPTNQRQRRSGPVEATTTPAAVHVCRLHVVADHTFVRHFGSAKDALKFMIKTVDDVNAIYLRTEFTTGDGMTFTGVGFELSGLTAFASPTVPSTSKDQTHFNVAPKSDVPTTASRLLQAFGDNEQNGLNLQASCLSHLVTHRVIADRVLGLAYLGSGAGNNSGGVCSGSSPALPSDEQQRRLIARNTGMTTFRRKDGQSLPTRQATLVMAHELAHNFGSPHDPQAGACHPRHEQGGAFLLHVKSVRGDEPNHSHLSPCSRRAMGNVIQIRLHGCFTNATGRVCGNGRRELDEDCDAGPVGDACCGPNCRFRAGAICSDANAPCCLNCTLAPAGQVCRRAKPLSPCHADAVCSGRNDTCPEVGENLADGADCLQGAGACRSGTCHSLCKLAGSRDCRCPAPREVCQLCCANDSACDVYQVARAQWSDCSTDINVDAVTGGMTTRLWRLAVQPGSGVAMRNSLASIIIFLSLLIWVPLCIVHDYKQNEYIHNPDETRNTNLQT